MVYSSTSHKTVRLACSGSYTTFPVVPSCRRRSTSEVSVNAAGHNPEQKILMLHSFILSHCAPYEYCTWDSCNTNELQKYRRKYSKSQAEGRRQNLTVVKPLYCRTTFKLQLLQGTVLYYCTVLLPIQCPVPISKTKVIK